MTHRSKIDRIAIAVFLLSATSLILKFFPLAAQSNDSNLVSWSSDYRLSYSDFKAKPADVSEVALTSSGFYFMFDYDGKENLKIIAGARFDKSKSWFKEDGKTPEVLMHEQTHFDITEVAVRLFRKFLTEKQFRKPMNFDQLLPRYYNEYLAKCSRAQNDYDMQTNHGINAKQQKEWEEKVSKQLQDLKQYDNPVLEFKLK